MIKSVKAIYDIALHAATMAGANTPAFQVLASAVAAAGNAEDRERLEEAMARASGAGG